MMPVKFHAVDRTDPRHHWVPFEMKCGDGCNDVAVGVFKDTCAHACMISGTTSVTMIKQDCMSLCYGGISSYNNVSSSKVSSRQSAVLPDSHLVFAFRLHSILSVFGLRSSHLHRLRSMSSNAATTLCVNNASLCYIVHYTRPLFANSST